MSKILQRILSLNLNLLMMRTKLLRSKGGHLVEEFDPGTWHCWTQQSYRLPRYSERVEVTNQDLDAAVERDEKRVLQIMEPGSWTQLL